MIKLYVPYSSAALDNEQRMMDPCNPLDFMLTELRHDWLVASVRFWRCDIAA